MGNFDPEFVESRRRALEKFLRRIAENPELGVSDVFIAFLQADDAEWSQRRSGEEVTVASMTEKATKWFQFTVNSVTVPKVRCRQYWQSFMLTKFLLFGFGFHVRLKYLMMLT